MWCLIPFTFLQEVTARPDIADDCFLLASRCLRYCPHLFIPSPIFSPIVDCAVIGMTVQHRFSLYMLFIISCFSLMVLTLMLTTCLEPIFQRGLPLDIDIFIRHFWPREICEWRAVQTNQGQCHYPPGSYNHQNLDFLISRSTSQFSSRYGKFRNLSIFYCIETDVFVAFETPFHLFMNVGFG